MHEPIRIALSGAASPLSYSLLFRIASGAMFGTDRPVVLSLLDEPSAMPAVEATIWELEDCDYPLLRSVTASTSPVEAFAGADWVLLLTGARCHEGATRAEQLRANGPIFQQQGRAINESAKSARILVVANPCNSNCLIAQSTQRDLLPERWFATTAPRPESRKGPAARKAGVPVEKVTRVTVWGNHGPSIFPDFHNAWIGDHPAHEVVHDDEWVRNVFEPGVARGASSLRTCEARRQPDRPLRRSWARFGRSRRPRRSASDSAPGWSPTEATACRGGWSSVFRCDPRTARLGRSSRTSIWTTTPSVGLKRTSPNSNKRR